MPLFRRRCLYRSLSMCELQGAFFSCKETRINNPNDDHFSELPTTAPPFDSDHVFPRMHVIAHESFAESSSSIGSGRFLLSTPTTAVLNSPVSTVDLALARQHTTSEQNYSRGLRHHAYVSGTRHCSLDTELTQLSIQARGSLEKVQEVQAFGPSKPTMAYEDHR